MDSEVFLEQLINKLSKSNLSIPTIVKFAFQEVDRIHFVYNVKSEAYKDKPLPIPENQTISAPHMYAMMMANEISNLSKGLNILEIGTGSGYGAALLARAVYPGKVVSIERHEKLNDFAKSNLSRSGITLDNLELLVGDGTSIMLNQKFDRIFVTAAGPQIPPSFAQLVNETGFVIMPLETDNKQWLTKIRYIDDQPHVDYMFQVRFVPLIGKYGH